MPNFDGTGPRGQGSGTGRGMGKCAKGSDKTVVDQVVVDRPRAGRGLRAGLRGRQVDGKNQ